MTNRYAVASPQADWNVLRRFPRTLWGAGVKVDWVQTSGWRSQNLLALRKRGRERNAIAASGARDPRSPSEVSAIAVTAVRSNGLKIAVVAGADGAAHEIQTGVHWLEWIRTDWDRVEGLAAGLPDPGLPRQAASSGVEAERAAPKGEGR
jgi:hypothetical protein